MDLSHDLLNVQGMSTPSAGGPAPAPYRADFHALWDPSSFKIGYSLLDDLLVSRLATLWA
jgi:hypothetical protein